MAKQVRSSVPAAGTERVEPGFVFCPTERDLTDVYLFSKIAGKALPGDTGRFIHVKDIYSAEPQKLVEKYDEAPGTGKGGDVHRQPVWYFFSPVRYVGGRKKNARGEAGRKARKIVGEAGKHWHSEKGEAPVKGGSKYGGYEQYFTYKVKNPSSGKEERPGWVMTEYGIAPEHGGGDLVLCKIHRRPPRASDAAEQDPIVSPKKRKAPAGDHPEDSTPSARPRHTDDDHPPLLVESHPAAEEPEWYGAAGLADHQSTDQAAPPSIFLENMEQDFCSSDHSDGVIPQGDLTWLDLVSLEDLMAEMYADHEPTDQAAPPSNFFENVEHDFWSLDQNELVMPLGDLAVPPWTPAAQPEDADAAGFLQMLTADEVPGQNYNDDGQMYASFGEEPDKTAADNLMIRRCSDDLMMPWQSMTFGLY